MLAKAILTLQNAWAAAITELGGLTYLLVENQVKKLQLIESILLSDRIYKQVKEKQQRRKPRYWVRPGRSDTLWENCVSGETWLTMSGMKTFACRILHLYIFAMNFEPTLENRTTDFGKW